MGRTTKAVAAAQANVFGQVFVAAQHLTRLADKELEPLGLTTSQWLLLAVVSRHPGGPPSLSEAAAIYGTSRQNVKQLARQLEARGYLELRADPEDARALRLHRTAAVASAFDTPQALRQQERFLSCLFDGLEAADVLALEGVLRRWLTLLAAP
jgi:DNA-binding MarR family transcriptional regulator